MAPKDQHVVPHGEKWAVRGEGNERATHVADTQAEAIALAKGIASREGSEVVIHDAQGRVRDSDSYGDDPFPPADHVH
jgi:hypothetical protein